MLDLIKIQDNIPFDDFFNKVKPMTKLAWDDFPRFAPYKPCMEDLKLVWETSNVMRAWLIYKDGEDEPIGYVCGVFQKNTFASVKEFNILSFYIKKTHRRLSVLREAMRLLRHSVDDRADFIRFSMPSKTCAYREDVLVVRV